MVTESVFYDHATNCGCGGKNAAQASAMARVRRELIAEGRAYRVDATPKNGGARFYWDGGHYDVLGLAKTLLFNKYLDVVMVDYRGEQIDIAAERY